MSYSTSMTTLGGVLIICLEDQLAKLVSLALLVDHLFSPVEQLDQGIAHASALSRDPMDRVVDTSFCEDGLPALVLE